MNTDRALHVMKTLQDTVARFGAGVPQSEKDSLTQIITKLESGTPLSTDEQQFVDGKIKTIYG